MGIYVRGSKEMTCTAVVPLFSNFKPLWYSFVDFEGLGCLFLNGALLLFMVREALPELHRLKQLRVETLHM